MDFIIQNPMAVAFVVVVGGFVAWRQVGFASVRKRLPELLRAGGLVVDVRSPAEFGSGHSPGARNIPLSDLSAGMGQLDRAKPVVVCCASGSRSGAAKVMLQRAGFSQVFNAGPWRNTLG